MLKIWCALIFSHALVHICFWGYHARRMPWEYSNISYLFLVPLFCLVIIKLKKPYVYIKATLIFMLSQPIALMAISVLANRANGVFSIYGLIRFTAASLFLYHGWLSLLFFVVILLFLKDRLKNGS